MVDLLGMFRRRTEKRSPQGFARPRADITALGDSIGDMLTSPVRDAPPMARDTPELKLEAHRGERPPPSERPPPAERPRPQRAKANKTNGAAAAPRLATRAGYLAVHSVEKSFGSRQVVRGVSIYVRRGEAVGLLGPNGAGKTTVFYMITGLIPADKGTIELDGHDVTKLPMYSARPARDRLSAAGGFDLSRPHGGAEYSRGAGSCRTLQEKTRSRTEFPAGRVQHHATA